MEEGKDRMRAECTWGDGPDVLLILDGKPLMLYENPSMLDKAVHGYVNNGSTCLTAQEALRLAASLTLAAKEAMALSGVYDEAEKASQQQGISSGTEGEDVKTVMADLSAHLRQKLLFNKG